MATSTTSKTTSKKSAGDKKKARTQTSVKQAQKKAQMLWNKREWKRLQWQRHSFYGWLGTLGVQLQGEDAPKARERLFPFIEEGDVSMADERGVPIFPEDKEDPVCNVAVAGEAEKQASAKTQNKPAKADKEPKKEASPVKNEENEEPSDSSTKSSSPPSKPAMVKECALKKQPVIVLSEEAGDAEEEKLFAEIREKLNYPASKSKEEFNNDLKSNKKLRKRFEQLLAERRGAVKGESEQKQAAEKDVQKAKPEPSRKSAKSDEDARRKRSTPLPVVSWHKDLAKLETYDYTGPVVNYTGFEKEIIAA